MLRDSDVNLYTFERLREQFGPFVEAAESGALARTEHDLVGAVYRRILAEMVTIVGHQWQEELHQSALKGFLLYGGVGLGKTSLGKRLAYELCRRFGDQGETARRDNQVVLVMVDGADIARGRYGDSEEQLKRLFDYAREGEFRGHHSDEHATRRTVVLFDDVESLFLSRSSGGAKEWHFSQNSVFFHNVDELDTARTALVLTTNRVDLVDAAITDRFLTYEFGPPSSDVIAQVVREKAAAQRLSDTEVEQLVREATDPAARITSIREVERLVLRTYVQRLLGPEGTRASAVPAAAR